jgi:hypothetical protein
VQLGDALPIPACERVPELLLERRPSRHRAESPTARKRSFGALKPDVPAPAHRATSAPATSRRTAANGTRSSLPTPHRRELGALEQEVHVPARRVQHVRDLIRREQRRFVD